MKNSKNEKVLIIVSLKFESWSCLEILGFFKGAVYTPISLNKDFYFPLTFASNLDSGIRGALKFKALFDGFRYSSLNLNSDLINMNWKHV